MRVVALCWISISSSVAQEAVLSMRCQIIDKSTSKQNMNMQRIDVTAWRDGGISLDSRDSGQRYLHPSEIQISTEAAPSLRSMLDHDLVQVVRGMVDATAVAHGLQDQGYEATLLDLDEDGVYRSWSHSTAYIERANTKSSDDVIDRIEYYDGSGHLVGEVVHQEWQHVNDRKLPAKSRLKYKLNGEQIVRIISYRGITYPYTGG